MATSSKKASSNPPVAEHTGMHRMNEAAKPMTKEQIMAIRDFIWKMDNLLLEMEIGEAEALCVIAARQAREKLGNVWNPELWQCIW